MDDNMLWVMEQKIKRTIENLEKNNMEAYYVEDEKAAVQKVSEIIKEGDTIAVGGSMTLFETGIIDLLRTGKYNFLDRYAENLTGEDIKQIFRKSFLANDYIVSSNAVTEDGELYNVDGNGNRVAAMLYGPDQVIVVVGVNKIVKDLDAAIKRNKEYSGPANNKRLHKTNPCTHVGFCMDCKSPSRICNDYVVIKRQGTKGRIKVVIVGKELGY